MILQSIFDATADRSVVSETLSALESDINKFDNIVFPTLPD